MKFVILLTFLTLVIAWLGWKIWKNNHNFRYILGWCLLYYWTFAGSWVFVIDQLTGAHGRNFGIQYYKIFSKLFPVFLDDFYFQMLLYFGLFFISIQLTIFLFQKNKSYIPIPNPKPIKISHLFFILSSMIFLGISYLVVHKNVIYASEQCISVYLALNTLPNSLITIHKLFNLIGLVTLFFGFSIYLSSDNSRYFSHVNGKKYGLAYFTALFVFLVYLMIIGNKHDLLFVGIFSVLFYIQNSRRIIYTKLLIFIGVIFIMLFSTDLTRGVPLFSSPKYNLNCIERKQKALKTTENINDTPNKILYLAFNNEMFYAQFSMYGAISKDIPFTYGSSLKSLGYSFIPRIILESRPEDIYTYYAREVNADEGQGYTIHHATAWYLNFGIFGLIFSGFFIGLIWFYIEYLFSKSSEISSTLIKIFAILSPFLFTAFIPTLLRSGPESYRSLLYEAFAIPLLIIYLSVSFTSFFNWIRQINKNTMI